MSNPKADEIYVELALDNGELPSDHARTAGVDYKLLQDGEIILIPTPSLDPKGKRDPIQKCTQSIMADT